MPVPAKPGATPVRRGWFWIHRVVLGFFASLLVLPATATTVRPPEFAELVNGSDYVIRARVTGVRSEVRPGARGDKIYTQVEVDVLEVIAGRPPGRVVLEMLGGRVGEVEVVVQGAPRFHVGDEDILFVSGNGRAISPLYAMMHGRYPVRADRQTGWRYVARSNDVPMQSVTEVRLPMTSGAAAEMQRRLIDVGGALTPAQFASQIREARKPEDANARLR